MDGGFGGHAGYGRHDIGSLQENQIAEGNIREFAGASEQILIR
jgi:hypothetical protein